MIKLFGLILRFAGDVHALRLGLPDQLHALPAGNVAATACPAPVAQEPRQDHRVALDLLDVRHRAAVRQRAVAVEPRIGRAVLPVEVVGVGVGLVIRLDGAAGADDALALVLNKLFKVHVSTTYLVSDCTILILSLSYIPLAP